MKSIHEITQMVKENIRGKSSNIAYQNDLLIIAIIFLVGTASFGLGRLSTISGTKEPIRIIEPKNKGEVLPANVSAALNREESDSGGNIELAPAGKYVASKTGSKYHFPWCAGARSISKKNKIWFDTKEEAEVAGYEPAGNCKGLK